MSKDDRPPTSEEIEARAIARNIAANRAASDAAAEARKAAEDEIARQRIAREDLFHRYRPVAGHGERDDDRELTRSRRR